MATAASSDQLGSVEAGQTWEYEDGSVYLVLGVDDAPPTLMMASPREVFRCLCLAFDRVPAEIGTVTNYTIVPSAPYWTRLA